MNCRKLISVRKNDIVCRLATGECNEQPVYEINRVKANSLYGRSGDYEPVDEKREFFYRDRKKWSNVRIHKSCFEDMEVHLVVAFVKYDGEQYYIEKVESNFECLSEKEIEDYNFVESKVLVELSIQAFLLPKNKRAAGRAD
jgi:DNA segregation ATPase FtsK/SpoIIIE-like protein